MKGVTRSWTREQCDDAFYDDMYNACLCAYPGWGDYLLFKSCQGTAFSLWAAVDTFSASYFGKVKKTFCENDCVLPYGSPTARVMF